MVSIASMKRSAMMEIPTKRNIKKTKYTHAKNPVGIS